MNFKWEMYCEEYAGLLESWLDTEARRFTGCSDGWLDYYEYWIHEDGIKSGENFWVLLAGSDVPKVVFVLGLSPTGLITISECFTDPAIRGKGIGSAALCELLRESKELIGLDIRDALAVVYPDNIASRKMFVKCGFHLAAAHQDGDALYYHYSPEMLCYCGHDCASCITRIGGILNNEMLLQESVRFYREEMKQDLTPAELKCCGGRSDELSVLCKECPFRKCCQEKGIHSCSECSSTCGMYQEYKLKYVNRCHQIS